MKQQVQEQFKWWQTVFDDKYLKTYVDVFSPTITSTQVNFLEKNLRLQKKQNILDLACGQGRHAIELAKRGYKVVGLDYSKHLLNIAEQKAKKEKLDIRFIRGDMRKLSFRNVFDAVINMYTSFGYFAKDADNVLVLKNVYRALKEKGLFLIDFNNSMRLAVNIIKNGTVNKKGYYVLKQEKNLSNNILLFTKHILNPINMRWLMKRSWEENSKKQSYQTNVRLYFLPEFKYLLQQNKFKIKKIWGDFDGQKFNLESPRLLILSEKIKVK